MIHPTIVHKPIFQLNPLSKNKFLSYIKLLACDVKFRKTLDYHLNR